MVAKAGMSCTVQDFCRFGHEGASPDCGLQIDPAHKHPWPEGSHSS
jgi:hypothetical protein